MVVLGPKLLCGFYIGSILM